MVDKKNKNEAKAKMLMLHYLDNANESKITGATFGIPVVENSINMFEMLLSAKTFISSFEQVYFVFQPKVSYIPNPDIVRQWLEVSGVKITTSAFISARYYRHEGSYEGVKMIFDIAIS